MRWSLNQITLHGGSRQPPQDLSHDLHALRAGGWQRIELWLAHWDSYIDGHGLAAARRLLDGSGLAASGGCGLGGLFFFRGEALKQGRDDLARRLEQCQALGASHFVVATAAALPDGTQLPEEPSMAEFERAVENGCVASELAAEYGIRLGIEFLAPARFLNTLPAAMALVERIDRANVGIVLDSYHLYAGASKIEDIDLLGPGARRLTFVHVSDVHAAKLRELWTVPDRILPGGGGIPNRALVERIQGLGYDADISLELFDAGFEAGWNADPIGAARHAYECCTAIVPDEPR